MPQAVCDETELDLSFRDWVIRAIEALPAVEKQEFLHNLKFSSEDTAAHFKSYASYNEAQCALVLKRIVHFQSCHVPALMLAFREHFATELDAITQ